MAGDLAYSNNDVSRFSGAFFCYSACWKIDACRSAIYNGLITMPTTNEISAIDLIKLCWASKITFLWIAACTISIGLIYHLQFNEVRHASQIKYDFPRAFKNYNPTTVERLRIAFDNKENFQAWSSAQENTGFGYNLMVGQTTINGDQFVLHDSDRLVSFTKPGLLMVKSNDVAVIAAVLDYFHFINAHISSSELTVIQKLTDDFFKSYLKSGSIVENPDFLSDYANLLSMENQLRNYGAVRIRPPSLPFQTSVGLLSVIIMASFVGLTIGLFIVLIRIFK